MLVAKEKPWYCPGGGTVFDVTKDTEILNNTPLSQPHINSGKRIFSASKLSFLDCQDRLRKQIKKHEKELTALQYENIKSMVLAAIFFGILCIIYAIIHIR